MKKTMFVLSVAFTIFTFIGLSYVLISHGQRNAGYAVVPMVLAIVLI